MTSLAPLHRAEDRAHPLRLLMAYTLPPLSLVLALVLGAVPWGVNLGRLFVPDLLAPVLFFWAVHQPRHVAILLVFVLGLMADVLDATPLGTQAAAYMVLALVAKSQAAALAGLGLFFKWALFALSMLVFVTVKLLVSLLIARQFMDLALVPAILKSLQLVLVTSMTYLGLHLVLSLINRALPQPQFLRQA